MPRDPRKYLYDISCAGHKIVRFVSGRSYEDYARDEMLQSAVERQFEIVGEALAQLSKLDPDLARKIPEYQRIIAFRNVLIHGYAAIDSRLVWGVVESKLTEALTVVDSMLDINR